MSALTSEIMKILNGKNVGIGSCNNESFDFLESFAIIIPWQHSGNSSSESQWKLCNRNKNKAYC